MLIATTANDGHFGPLVGRGRACSLRAMKWALRRHSRSPRQCNGVVSPIGPLLMPLRSWVGPVMGRLPSLSFEEANATVMREVFGRIDAQAALPAVSAAVEQWSPDLVVREPAEFGSLAAAELAGVPHVQVMIGMLEFSRIVSEFTAEPLDELASLAGLADGSLGRCRGVGAPPYLRAGGAGPGR